MTRKTTISISLYGLIILLLVGYGCSRGLETAVVSGNVIYQGKPIPDGEVFLMPIEGTKGPASSGSIKNGRYEITARGGVPAGTHRLKISAWRTISKTNPIADDAPGIKTGELPTEQYLPKKFNEQSELKITIEPGQRKITKDFKGAGTGSF